jgi:hypothetical protein
MERDFYKSPKPSKIMRFFWKAAGGDSYILERSTYSDQVKYMCLGGIIVATGLMAALAGGYAFYTIFEPRGSAIEADTVSWTTSLLSIIFGAFWGLMIFNLDRFIVSSTGVGDGTEAITWGELKGAIPRLLMGAIIALTISKPVEIRMFKSEIDAALHEEQLKVRKDYEKRTRANYEDRLALIKEEQKKFDEDRNDLLERVKKAEKEHTDQLQGRAGAPAGDGKLSQALEKIKNNLIAELDKLDENNKERITELKESRKKLISEMDKELAKNEEVASGLDGLLERIKLAHKIAGFWISLFITLLFLAIELTPIFFKLMLIKSPYDFLKQNTQELIKAEQGIYIQYNYHKDKNGQERDLIRHLESEKLLLEKKELLKAQEELTQYAISKYKEDMMKKIDENPESFIKSED